MKTLERCWFTYKGLFSFLQTGILGIIRSCLQVFRGLLHIGKLLHLSLKLLNCLVLSYQRDQLPWDMPNENWSASFFFFYLILFMQQNTQEFFAETRMIRLYKHILHVKGIPGHSLCKARSSISA